MTAPTPPPTVLRRRLPTWLRVVHVVVITLFLVQCVYSLWQVFVVMRPQGQVGLLFGMARDLPTDFLAVRRLYAIEGWLAVIGLSLYLGITEILPRRLRP